jgi:chloramphenicol-sensitive protein RarD
MRRQELEGGLYATAAFLWWGLAPLYWREVRDVPGVEMVAHRIVWSVPFVWLLVARRRRLGEVGAAIRDRRHLRLLVASAALLAVNWVAFIEAIRRDLVLEASLGYYVNPLLNVVLGTVFLRERLTPLQVAAVLLAAAGVTWLAVDLGVVPWVALLLAGTFGAYGLLRKRAEVDSLVGLAVETAVLAPVALAGILVAAAMGASHVPAGDLKHDAFVVGSGLVTALPLLWFAHAARRLRYVTVGFFQYLAPTGQFLLAVFAFGERFTTAHAVAFGCIWVAVALYLITLSSGLERRPRSPA